jgi:signal transduction histidine kinase
VFDLFRQADNEAPRSRSGLGIGLALVRCLVESHGGLVTGESAGLGRGSEFTVCLPREDAAAG